MIKMKTYDIIIIGGGAAGFFAARAALAGGACEKVPRRVLILDMGAQPLRKVLASGGGRCNFTNTDARAARYYGNNPDFVISALARVSPRDILDWAAGHGLTAVEKAAGQYFCAQGARAIADALISDAADADIIQNAAVIDVERISAHPGRCATTPPEAGNYIVKIQDKSYVAKRVIVATGGVSFPELGVSDIGYKIAKKFGHKIVPPTPGLVALKTDIFPNDLAGISLGVQVIGNPPHRLRRSPPPEAGNKKSVVRDSLLFTHFGIGGPAAYRASMFDLDADFHINFLPDVDAFEFLKRAKNTDGAKQISTVLSLILPEKFARWLLSTLRQGYGWRATTPSTCGGHPFASEGEFRTRPVENHGMKKLAEWRDADLRELARRINDFIIPGGTLSRRGFQSAEVTKGGIATDSISSKTFESKLCPGLYFVGETLDVTGDLGGFNLHFAFASGHIAGTDCTL